MSMEKLYFITQSQKKIHMLDMIMVRENHGNSLEQSCTLPDVVIKLFQSARNNSSKLIILLVKQNQVSVDLRKR